MAQTSVLTSGNNGWRQNTENGFFRPKGGNIKFGMRGQSIYNLFKYSGARV